MIPSQQNPRKSLILKGCSYAQGLLSPPLPYQGRVFSDFHPFTVCGSCFMEQGLSPTIISCILIHYHSVLDRTWTGTWLFMSKIPLCCLHTTLQSALLSAIGTGCSQYPDLYPWKAKIWLKQVPFWKTLWISVPNSIVQCPDCKCLKSAG